MERNAYHPENALRLAKKAVYHSLRGGTFESSFCETEDLIQETLLAFCSYCSRHQDVRDYASLMFGIAEKVVKSAIRRKRRDWNGFQTMQRIHEERVPLNLSAFPIEEIQALRDDLQRAEARVIDFILDNPCAGVDEILRRLGITFRAYEGSFYRIRNKSSAMRHRHAIAFIENNMDLCPAAIRKLYSFTQCREERLEFATATAVRCCIPWILNRVQDGDMHWNDHPDERAAVRMLNRLIERVKPKDPALQLSILDWRIHYFMGFGGAPAADGTAATWIRLAAKLIEQSEPIPVRFEWYVNYWFETHSGADHKLYCEIIRTFDELQLPSSHHFRKAMSDEQNRKQRPEWMLPGNYKSPFVE